MSQDNSVNCTIVFNILASSFAPIAFSLRVFELSKICTCGHKFAVAKNIDKLVGQMVPGAMSMEWPGAIHTGCVICVIRFEEHLYMTKSKLLSEYQYIYKAIMRLWGEPLQLLPVPKKQCRRFIICYSKYILLTLPFCNAGSVTAQWQVAHNIWKATWPRNLGWAVNILVFNLRLETWSSIVRLRYGTQSITWIIADLLQQHSWCCISGNHVGSNRDLQLFCIILIAETQTMCTFKYCNLGKDGLIVNPGASYAQSSHSSWRIHFWYI